MSEALSAPGNATLIALVVNHEAGAAGPPVLTTPTASTATGPTHASVRFSIDAVSGSGTRTAYVLPRVGGSAASSATIIATGTAQAVTAAGAQTIPVTGLTTNVGAVADCVYVDPVTGTSNVATTGTFTPATLAIAGTALSAQNVVTGAALAWAGVTPESLVSNVGIGTPATPWTVLSGAGASGVTGCNPATGELICATGGTVAAYSVVVQRVDASTAGTTIPQAVTKTVALTINAAASFNRRPATMTGGMQNLTGGT